MEEPSQTQIIIIQVLLYYFAHIWSGSLSHFSGMNAEHSLAAASQMMILWCSLSYVIVK